MKAALSLSGVARAFVLHEQGGLRLPVLRGIDLELRPGECLALTGESGAGKSTLLRIVYGRVRTDAGRVLVRHGAAAIDVARAPPRQVVALRRQTVGHVDQFLRALPRLPAVEVVAEPLLARGQEREAALALARRWLARLNLPGALADLPPATFSGGERQRVNLARGFAPGYPLLLLDEPAAALDRANRDRVAEAILEARERGAAILAVFHDDEMRRRVATRTLELAGGALAASGA